MADRTAVITGAAGGIGQATASLLKREGWFVIGLDLEPAEVDRFIECDLSMPDQIDAAFAAIAEIGHVDLLVNNAGINTNGDPMGSVENWDAIMAVNARAVFQAAALVSPLMRDRAGAIVNVSSVHALATSRGRAAYAASKGALLSMTRALALDLGPEGIRVNAVLPGAVDTPMLVPGKTGAEREGRIAELASKTPLGRVGRPEEIAEVVLFLADSSRSSFVTGQTLVVDGGVLARLASE
jgi:glucose 1-dehydrogenase